MLFLLGAAGLLDGKRVATHWMSYVELSRQFPKISFLAEQIFVRDGRLWSSAGVTAGIDMSLAMVEQDLGHSAAISVARELVLFLKRPADQAQFSKIIDLQHLNREFENLHSWIADNLSSDLSIPQLATWAGMSKRNFARRYLDVVGLTPARSVERIRVEAAQSLLATSPLPVKRVAAQCGFGSEETMRRSFIRQNSIAPSDYRNRLSGNFSRKMK